MNEQQINKSDNLNIGEQQNPIVESKTGRNKKLKIISSLVKIISFVLICAEWIIALGFANMPERDKNDPYLIAFRESYKKSDKFFFDEGVSNGGVKIFFLLIVNLVTVLLVRRIAKILNCKQPDSEFLLAIQKWNREHTDSITKIVSFLLVILEWILFIDILDIPSKIVGWTVFVNVVTVLLLILTLGSIDKDKLRSWFHLGKK